MRSVNVVRARLVDQGERARPPWEGRRHDPMPPSSPGEIPAGPSTLSEAAVPVEGEAESRPQPRKRHQKRLLYSLNYTEVLTQVSEVRLDAVSSPQV